VRLLQRRLGREPLLRLPPADGRALERGARDRAGDPTHDLGGEHRPVAAERLHGTRVVDRLERERAVRALGAVGGRADLRGTSGWSHALIGVRGARAGDAIEDWGPRAVRAVVGRDRPVPLGLTLEAFELF